MDVILPLRPLLQVWWLLKTARSTPSAKRLGAPLSYLEGPYPALGSSGQPALSGRGLYLESATD